PAKLHDIVRNLVENAVNYSPEGAEVRLGAMQRDGTYMITVADSGPGIPAEDLTRVFERFYRVDKARARPGGTGWRPIARKAGRCSPSSYRSQRLRNRHGHAPQADKQQAFTRGAEVDVRTRRRPRTCRTSGLRRGTHQQIEIRIFREARARRDWAGARPARIAE